MATKSQILVNGLLVMWPKARCISDHLIYRAT